MICPNCGVTNPDSSYSCSNCGNQLQPMNQYPSNAQYPQYPNNTPYPYNGNQYPMKPPGDGKATASLVCGIVSFFCCGLVLSILAIVLGKLAANEGYVGGKAKAGIVIGIVSLVLYAVLLVIYFALLASL